MIVPQIRLDINMYNSYNNYKLYKFIYIVYMIPIQYSVMLLKYRWNGEFM